MGNSKGIITNGRFRFNNIDKEVNKTYKGYVASRSLYLGSTHIWPSYEIFCIDKTTSFVGSENSNWKDKQTGVSTYNFSKYSYTNIPKAIDPAGGIVSTSIINRESSYWHCLSIEVTAYTRCNDDGAGMVLADNAISYDTNVKPDGNPYIESIEVIDEESQVAIVPNDEYKWNVKRWNIGFNQKDDLPLDFATTGALLGVTIPPNNNPFATIGMLRITGFLNEAHEFQTVPTNVHEGILTWVQDPNIIYKVQMCWVTGDGIPTPLDKDEIQTIGYTTTTKSYWLCLEFGVSKTGGTDDSDFLWNQDLEPEITIPNNLASMVKASVTGADADRFNIKVNNAIKTNNKNYVEIIVTPTSNNDYAHNTNRTPIYKAEVNKDKSTELATSTDNATSTISWQLQRYTTTQPWNATIQIKFIGSGALSNFTGSM